MVVPENEEVNSIVYTIFMTLIQIATGISQVGPFFSFLLYFSMFASIICGIIDWHKKRFYWSRWTLLLFLISLTYLIIEVILSFTVVNSLSN